ncbi:X-linked retinitis pigmentosa GTPase regulator-interacting protein 1 isoform X2 [Hyperolius riggenbachi]|uniref:X-linked retinitis pigmentosa GTPase regulator-interacting protein 1 isoform X2 n=1 Tax=Hyperolius riggenbachi TaxID=752182 RepID=UPI0035A2D10F
MSVLDETASDLPVKDTDCKPAVLRAIQDVTTGTNQSRTLIQKSPKTKGLRVQGSDTGTARVPTDYYGESLSDEVRAEIDRLFQLISRHNCSIDERFAILLKHMATAKPKDLETELRLSLQHMQQAENQRTLIQENVMTIRLQKELREKNTSLCALREQFQQLKESYETELQEKQKSLTLSHKAVLVQLEELGAQLKEERSKVVVLELDQQNVANLQKSLMEYQERVKDLEKEKELLKENFENLLKSSLESEQVSSWRGTEAELKAQITRLEEQIQCHERHLAQSQEHLQHETDKNDQLNQEVSRLHFQLLEKKQEIHNLQDKISAISSAALAKKPSYEQVPIQEDYQILKRVNSVREDLWNTEREKKRQKESEENSHKLEETVKSTGSLEERMEVEDEEKRKSEQNTKRKMLEMDAAHAETILELEKTREMLILQHQINKDYQEEMKSVKLKAESENREKEDRERLYEAKLLKHNSKIQMLEAQLRDVAYGTFPYRLRTEDLSSPEASVSPPPMLQRGETLFEVHIGGICFSPNGIRVVDDPQPVTFCIYSLYDFETHATPVVSGISPQYNFTSRYAVTPDPEFLRYLRVGVLTVELYQVIGGEHHELGRGRMRLDTTLQSTDRFHSTIIMTDATGENIGELDYWLRLHGPLSHAQCLQRQRSKAKVYFSTPRHHAPEKAQASQLNNGNQNALIIHIWGCRSLKASTLGHQPSPYIVYHFYHYPDHSSSIIPCSNNPQFGDEAVYPVRLTLDLERYLQREYLHVYVFDDEETQPGGYLGKAEVRLQSLAQGNTIQGDFALINPSGKCAGSVQISLEWKFPYHSPGKSLWEAVTSGDLIQRKVQEASVLQHQFLGKQLSKDAQKAHLSRSRPTKSRKSEEELHRDVGSNKRGRTDGHVTDVHMQGRRHDVISSNHHSDDVDMTVEDIETEQEDLQERETEQQLYEEINEPDHDATFIQSEKPPEEIGKDNVSESKIPCTDDDEDDVVIVSKPLFPYKLPSSRIRVEIASLMLDPCSEVVADESVERVFVEFQFAGVPLEETETPLSLRKPRQGEEIYYHFSKVIYLDGKEHADRRHFLYMLLEGSDSHGERARLKFTVVSDPMNEEDDECCDVGYAYLDLKHLMRRSVEPAEETLQIIDVTDPRQIIGSLRVVIEAREAMRAVYREKRMKTTRSSMLSIMN